ncbi:phosphatase PAP2 family protein [Streptomyces sp. N2-109]|uniref:Phosphatase PAP2 family protein n=1 Tax=Streptomyces gossypii TaxID=2883101 RepID=A0ABT2JXU9_9ACTN|nr:vanadium-dependent haloperoxidase [Streptomyces gossypii]MCT2592727.1 phosphatase PAP2 family protein [Streptomyces gossypii]
MDPILYWNEAALEADRVTHTTRAPEEAGTQGPLGSSRALAIVHLSMHDAYFGINVGHPCYLGADLPQVAPGADVSAAIAGAAHSALSALYPAQKAYFDAWHAAAQLTAGKPHDDGHAFGNQIAARVLELRRGDPGYGDDGYASSPLPPHHRLDPDAQDQGFYAPFYGARSRCFAVTERHSLDAPAQPGTAEYSRAYREVRSKGIAPELVGTLPAELLPSRTAAETSIGVFWGYDGARGLGTPPRLLNQIIRQVAVAQGNELAQNARLFALVNTAMADAGILAWSDKYTFDLWRPVVGIREHDFAVGPARCGGEAPEPQGDPGWLPLGAPNTNNVGQKNTTPPFPTYPSGHATFGAAALQSARLFYGQGNLGPDTLTRGLEFVSDEFNGTNADNSGTVRPRLVRRFPGGLWQMIEENGRSRVYLGVHWVFDAFAVDEANEVDLSRNIGGVRLGLDIANDIAAHGLTSADAAGPAAR